MSHEGKNPNKLNGIAATLKVICEVIKGGKRILRNRNKNAEMKNKCEVVRFGM
jgi:hypothetical protein